MRGSMIISAIVSFIFLFSSLAYGGLVEIKTETALNANLDYWDFNYFPDISELNDAVEPDSFVIGYQAYIGQCFRAVFDKFDLDGNRNTNGPREVEPELAVSSLHRRGVGVASNTNRFVCVYSHWDYSNILDITSGEEFDNDSFYEVRGKNTLCYLPESAIDGNLRTTMLSTCTIFNPPPPQDPIPLNTYFDTENRYEINYDDWDGTVSGYPCNPDYAAISNYDHLEEDDYYKTKGTSIDVYNHNDARYRYLLMSYGIEETEGG